MSKNNPTHKNIRQGQTVYYISHAPAFYGKPSRIVSYFLYSHKEALPTPGTVIDKMPVSMIKAYLKELGNRDFFFSRKKAISSLRLNSEHFNAH